MWRTAIGMLGSAKLECGSVRGVGSVRTWVSGSRVRCRMLGREKKECVGCGGVRCGMFVCAKCGEVKGVFGCVFVSGQLILLAAKLLNNLSIIQDTMQ